MAITRSQIARQLMQEGGVPRQGYFLGKLVKKFKDDIIPNELKSPLGLAAAATAANFAPTLFGKDTILTQLSDKVPFIGTVTDAIGGGLKTVKDAATEALKTEVGTGENKTTLGNRLLSGILGGPGLALASGLLAGALTKDKEDPLYTGQDVGLNLQDIGKLANITDPLAGQAIGLRFLPDVEARKFTPEQMAASFAANAPRDFTEQRQQAQDGGIMGDQKDFEEFLQDMQNRDKQMLQDRILKDFEKFMKRKRMIEQMPEAKDGGIMKMADGGMMMASNIENEAILERLFEEYLELGFSPEEAAKKAREEFDRMGMKKGKNRTMAAEGGMMDMGGMEMDLRGGGFVPMGKAEKADDVPARLSKNEFVFTADAVRAAGGGDVDKGADKMYATMKKLEDRVA